MSKGKKFGEVLHDLCPTYKNIDIRILSAYSRNEHDGHKCIFLRLYLSKDDSVKIENTYREKENALEPQHTETFQLISECQPIGNIDRIISDLEMGRITIKNQTLKICEVQGTKIMALEIQNYKNLYVNDDQYNHWFVAVSQNHSAISEIDKLGSIREELGVDFHSLNQWFDISYENWKKISIRILILLPIYITRTEKTIDNNGTLFVKYDIHQQLLNDIENPRIKLSYNNNRTKHLNGELNNKSISSIGDTITILLCIKIDDLIELLNIEISFVHRYLKSILFVDEIKSDELGIFSEKSMDFKSKFLLDNFSSDGFAYMHIDKISIETTMGDRFENINNSTIVNKSNVVNAFNKVKEIHGEDMGKAILDIAYFIEKSQEHAAGVLFDNFTKELDNSQPDKSKLKSLWLSIERTLPTINNLTTVVAKIVSLFN